MKELALAPRYIERDGFIRVFIQEGRIEGIERKKEKTFFRKRIKRDT